MKTPISTMNAAELTAKLTQVLEQAYFRRSRNLPANIAAITETLKGDLLKAFPDIPFETVDDAIITETLHSTDSISPAFFFQAVKKVWWQPKTNRHQWDEDTPSRRDTEQDNISLLDTCAEMLRRMDAAEAQGRPVTKVGMLNGVRIALPAFNTRREYGYLILRGQLDADAATNFTKDAIVEVNIDRMETGHHRLTKEEAEKSPEVSAKAMRLAVLDWLRSCNTRNTTPSAILIPLADENSYQRYRHSAK